VIERVSTAGKRTFFSLPLKRLGRLATLPRPQFRQTAIEVIVIGNTGLRGAGNDVSAFTQNRARLETVYLRSRKTARR